MLGLDHVPDPARARRGQGASPSGRAPGPGQARTGCHATEPVWSWDITKLHGPAKWSYYYLYVIIDIYSRYVVGWLIADAESKALAEKLLADTIAKQGIDRDQLTIHADNGSSMASKPVAFLLADLGVTKSHSRPHTSNDNPYSEAQFRTLSTGPTFPTRSARIADARAFCQRFFTWYNTEHCHSGIAWLHPIDVHYGQAETSAPSAPTSSTPPTPATPTGSSASPRNQRPYPPQPGSTSHPDRGRAPGGSVNESLKLLP